MDNNSRFSKRSIFWTCLTSFFVFFIFWLVFLKPDTLPQSFTRKAVVVLRGNSTVTGTVTFEQSTKTSPVTVTGDLTGLDPLSKRGFHIHQFGDATNGCLSAGGHFNPFRRNHGAPEATSNRHVGDLGNIESDRDGVAKFTLTDSQVTLNGLLSVVGRSVVVHEGTDDLGLGDNPESLVTGNAGGRAACGVIGFAA